MRKNLMIVVGLAVLTSVSGASAQPASPGFWPGMMAGNPGYFMHGMWPGRYAIIDVNDDGQVSMEEAAASAEQIFAAMDADGDGTLTLEEHTTPAFGYGFGMGWNVERQSRMQEHMQERFASMDANGDDLVSKSEFLDVAKAHHEAADTDNDGIVTPWEHRRVNWY